MRTFIKKVQASATPAILAEAKNNIDRFFKLWNLDLYYNNLYIEYYYFCQQYKDYFEIVRSLGHKRKPHF